MHLILLALAVWTAGGTLSLLVGRKANLVSWLAPAMMLLGGAMAAVPSVEVLAGGETLSASFAWDVPFGQFDVAMDALSALFAVAIVAVCVLAAIYGGQYLRSHGNHRCLGGAWFFYHLLAASMLLVVIARNGMLFLVAWEVMSLASFFLVLFESEKESVRRAGWTYLVATHLGTSFLLAMFVLLGREGDSLDFARFHVPPETASAVFLLALVGFGTKAGLVPLHVWLPEAHPAAPSHVSAVMSGVMIKTGIYGLVRTITFLGLPPAWWGWLLVGIGAVSGILGVLFALAQHDLKRLLAYHSVENIGIILLGLGLGLLGVSYGNTTMAALGFAGGLLHVINHAVFKSLLFLGAGAVLDGCKTGEIDELGGLLKRMPFTGAAFLVGAAAICGLPPLNGFVSELLVYLSAFHGLLPGDASGGSTAGIVAIGSLALIGGLAAACFTKAFGVIFLGEPRSEHARHGHEAGRAMRLPMGVLAAACLLIGVAGPWLPQLLAPAVQTLLPRTAPAELATSLGAGRGALASVCLVSGVLLGIMAVLVLARRRLLRDRTVEEAGTWDCGYMAPRARMQYTASSFAEPITRFFRVLLGTRDKIDAPQGFFPAHAGLHTETPDAFRERLYRPVFSALASLAARLHWLQQGRIQLYVLYIAVTLLVLVFWKLG